MAIGIGVTFAFNLRRGGGAGGGGGGYTLNGAIASATGSALDPTVVADVLVSGTVAAATGSAIDPTVAADTLLTPAAALATGSGVDPTVSADLFITPAVAAATGSAPDPFIGGISIPATVLNGVSNYRAFTTAPTGAAAGSAWTVVWAGTFQSDGSAMTLREIRNGTGVVMSLRRTATNTIEFKGWQSDASTAVFSNVTSAVPASTGRVIILASCSGTTSYLEVVKVSDGTRQTGTNTPGTAGNIDATGVWYYGRTQGGSEYLDAIVNYEADAAEAIDFSQSGSREEFYDSSNNEIRDPGSDGSNPFSAQPLVSFQGVASDFLTNAGSGGDADEGSNSGNTTSPGEWAADYSPVTLAFAVTATPAADTTITDTYTFSSQSIGAAATGRVIYVAVNLADNGSQTPTVTLTCNGDSMTKIVDALDDTVEIRDSLIFAIPQSSLTTPSATTADFVVGTGVSFRGAQITVYRGVGYSASASDTMTDITTDPVSGSLTKTDNGIAIAAATSRDASATAWTGLTEDVDVSLFFGRASTASEEGTTAGADTVTATFTGAGDQSALAAAAFAVA